MWKIGLLYFLFYCPLLKSSSYANKLIVGRAEAKNGKIALDLFKYTNESSCGNADNVNPWCNQRNAESLVSHDDKYKCSCQCKWDMITFLLDERRCVNDSYLISRFGNGDFILYPAIDLTMDGYLDKNNFKDFQVKKVEYHKANNVWQEMNLTVWSIAHSGKLTWKRSTLDEVNGKIIKIQICKQEQQRFLNQNVFCKSKGNSSIKIMPDVSPTPTASVEIRSTVVSLPIYTIPATYKPQPSNGSKHSDNETASPIGAIVGAIIACFIVIVIVVIFIIWKRYKQHSRPNSLRKPTIVTTNSTGNPTYGQNEGDIITLPHRQDKAAYNTGNEEYDYAKVDVVPSDHQKPSTCKTIYQSLIKDNVRDSVYFNKEGTNSTSMEYSYNHLQHPQYNPPRSKSDPLYNTTLEIPDDDEYLEPETQIIDNPTGVSEPVYNVLEGPDASSAPHDDDPVYNVLEDPNANQDNDPVYNVLEGPDDDYDNAPIDDDQNIPTSGQDNVAYSSTIDLNIPHSPSSPDYDVLEGPEGALPDSTYQPLSIRVQDDVYQPLDRASQSIYQTLEPNDSKA